MLKKKSPLRADRLLLVNISARRGANYFYGVKLRLGYAYSGLQYRCPHDAIIWPDQSLPLRPYRWKYHRGSGARRSEQSRGA